VAIEFEYAPGATPLDAQDAAALKDSHVTTRGQVDELEFQNVAAGMQWAYGRKADDILTVEFMLYLGLSGNRGGLNTEPSPNRPLTSV
jgi:hypothetical protein